MTTAAKTQSLPAAPAPAVIPPLLVDEVFEKALLGGLLCGASPAEFQPFAHLTEDHFFSPRHKRLWAAMSALYAEGLTIDLVTIKGRLNSITPEGEAFLFDMIAHAGSHPTDYAKLLRLVEWRRAVHGKLLSLLTMNANRKLSAQDVAAALQSELTQLQIMVASLVGPMSRLMTDLVSEYETAWLANDPTLNAGFSTGYLSLNRVMGGFERRRVYVVSAASGVGKSTFAQNIMRRVTAQGLHGMILSFEMAEEEYAQRAISAESEIQLDRIKEKSLSAQEGKRVLESIQTLKTVTGKAHVVFMKKPTLAEVEAKILELYYAHGLDFLVIDYVAARWLTPTEAKHKKDDIAFIGAISSKIISMAKELNIVIMPIVQTNRAGQSRGGLPENTDLAGAASLEQDADFVGFLKDDEDFAMSMGYGITNLYITKSRTGGQGAVLPLQSRKAMFRFDDGVQS